MEAQGLRSAAPAGVVVAQNRGSPTAPARLTLARARSCPLAGWPGVFPWIRRSRLDIDKWLTEGEPNTAPLLHMQGHPFVRAGLRGGCNRGWQTGGLAEGVERTSDDRHLRPPRHSSGLLSLCDHPRRRRQRRRGRRRDREAAARRRDRQHRYAAAWLTVNLL